ncbi:MAG: HemK/PrmC family methyltransferase [Siculibacillus sp.]
MRTHRFMGVELEIAPGALIPREETELLGRTALELLAALDHAPRVIDMCCGSGNLACAIAVARPDARVWGCDLTEETVDLARRNVVRLGLTDRVVIARGDLFAALDGLDLDGVDLVVANPPYISTARLEGESAHLLENEPREAFDGGPYGIALHQRLVREAAPRLVPGGRLAFEFGEGQERQVAALLTRARIWEPVDWRHDPAGRPRVAVVRRPIEAP